MRTVKFAEQFGEHLLEVEVVVDMREELRICLLVSLPVDSMYFRLIEFLAYLLPDMVEYIFALLGRLVFELAAECYAFSFS